MKSITLPQALVLVACLVAPIAAYKLLSSSVEAAGATAMVGMIINFLLGRDDKQDPPPPAAGPPGPGTRSIGFIGAATLSLCLGGCGTFLEAKDPTSILEKCAGEARAEYLVGEKTVEEAMAVFEACKKREGL